MSKNIREWLTVSNESAEAEEAQVIVQEGETPKEDFSTAVNEDTTEVETDKPAVAEIPAASDNAPVVKEKDEGHQIVLVVSEEDFEKVGGDVRAMAQRIVRIPAGAIDRVSLESVEPTAEQDDGADHSSSDVVEEEEVADVEVAEVVIVEVEPAEAGDEQKTPAADEQVHAQADE